MNPHFDPNSKLLTIPCAGKEFENSSMDIINASGEVILKLPFSRHLNVAKLSNGVYKLKIRTGNNQLIISRFIKV